MGSLSHYRGCTSNHSRSAFGAFGAAATLRVGDSEPTPRNSTRDLRPGRVGGRAGPAAALAPLRRRTPPLQRAPVPASLDPVKPGRFAARIAEAGWHGSGRWRRRRDGSPVATARLLRVRSQLRVRRSRADRTGSLQPLVPRAYALGGWIHCGRCWTCWSGWNLSRLEILPQPAGG